MKRLMVIISMLFLASCASQQAVKKKIEKMEVGPSETPKRIITNFSDGLRCMDNMLIEYGIRDISIIVEDLEDKTSKVKAGTKDMLITAVSSMTRRSRAIKLIAYGNDSGNIIGFLGNAGSQSLYNVIPQYDIRGSISQLDKSVVTQQSGISLAGDKWGVGGSRSVNGSILGIDLSVLSTDDLSVIPGVTSSNSVILFKSGSGADADASIKKVGISFDFTVSRSEATIQALRNLIELASIELIGKLVKVPYWNCLDIPSNTAEIQQEMEDWFYSMYSHGELIPFVRSLLIARNYYQPVVNDEIEALKAALGNFKQSVNLPADAEVDYATFSALLNSKTAKTTAVAIASDDQKSNKAASSKKQPSPASRLNLSLVASNAKKYFSPGEVISLTASTNESAYIYCYLIDPENQVQRFFPNRFQKDNYIAAGSTLLLPGQMPFDLIANEEGKTETVSCFASRKNYYSALPDSLKVYDFEMMTGKTIGDVRNGYRTTVKDGLAEASFEIRPR